jgi:hypothetical protein
MCLYAQGLDVEWCKNPDRGLPAPDAVLYLKLSVDTAMTRYVTTSVYAVLRGVCMCACVCVCVFCAASLRLCFFVPLHVFVYVSDYYVCVSLCACECICIHLISPAFLLLCQWCLWR